MAVRRLSQDDLDTLLRYLNRGAQPPAAVEQRLREHVAYLGGEAFRATGSLRTDIYEDAESAVQAY